MTRQRLAFFLLLLPYADGFSAPPSRVLAANTIKRSAPSVVSPLALSGDATLIDQLTDPLLLQHMATGGALAFAGDVIAQSLLSKSMPPNDWDITRTKAFVVFGAVYTGGAQHFIFNFLNNSFDQPLARLAMAQFFFIPFCYYPTFLFITPALRAGWECGFGTVEAKARQTELFTEIASKIPPTLLRNWCFWLPVQFVQFNFIPAGECYYIMCTILYLMVLSLINSSSSSQK